MTTTEIISLADETNVWDRCMKLISCRFIIEHVLSLFHFVFSFAVCPNFVLEAFLQKSILPLSPHTVIVQGCMFLFDLSGFSSFPATVAAYVLALVFFLAVSVQALFASFCSIESVHGNESCNVGNDLFVVECTRDLVTAGSQ